MTQHQYHPQWGKTESFPLRSGTRQGCPLSPLLFNIVLEVSASVIRQHKEIKGIQVSQEEVKLSLFTDDMILYMENPKDSTKKLLELIHEFSKVAGHKINAEKSVAFLYTNNEATEREIKELIPFTVAPKTIIYLGINLTKEVKNLYIENYRKLMKEIEGDTRKWKKISCSWIGRTNIAKTSILPNLHIQCNLYQSNTSIFHRARIILKFVWNQKRP